MASSTDFPARGKIIEIRQGVLVFQPSNTNYELHLGFADDAKLEVSVFPVEVLIRVDSRKTYTVPSGGNFITPIFGPPKIIQGRVKYADEKTIVIHAGCPIIVRLPDADSAIDLSEGKIQVGHMANVVALPGAKVELLAAAVTG